MNVSSAAARSSFFDPFASEESKKEPSRVRNGIDMITCPKTGQIICRPRRNKENPSSDAPPHFFPPVHLSESNDSKVNDELGLESSKKPLVPESKDTVADPVGVTSECLPSSEDNSDSETELPFQFPAKVTTSAEEKYAQSPLHPPARMSSSSSDEATTEVKQ